MRFWPQKKWKQIVLVSVLAFVLVAVGVLGFIYVKISSDYVSEVEVLNAGGSKTALLIYHPGLSSFMQDVTYAFADGLVESNWRVEITTPSSEAPTDLSGYSLLVLGSPVYAGNATVTISRHLDRIGDLEGIDTILLVTSAGSDGGAEAVLEQIVEEHNGAVGLVLPLFNSQATGANYDPLAIARQVGRDYTVAVR